LLDSLRRGQRWLILIFVSLVGFVFVFFIGTGGGFGPSTPTGNAVVQLDDIRLTADDLDRQKRTLEERLRGELGDEAYEQLGADQYLDSQALSQLVNSLVLSTAARDLGLEVTKDEIRRLVQSLPNFIDEEGRFSPERFDEFAQRDFGSQRAFMDVLTRDLLGQKLIQLVASQTTISDAELDLNVRYDREDVTLAYVAFDEAMLPPGESVSDEDAEAWAAAHDTELRERFAARSAELSQPERIRARHILISVASDATEADLAAARDKAQAARDRVLAGEDFGAVAQAVSNDPQTASLGGDLGTFARGINDPALDDAAFALEAGGVSEVIRSIHGFHVLRVDEKLPAEPATFEAHRLALAREDATRERATKLAQEGSAALAAAIAGGQSLEDAAREAELTIERPPSLKRRQDGFVPGLGAAKEVLATAFTLEPGQSSPEIFDVEDKRVLIQVLARTRLDEAQLAGERALRRDQARAQKQNEILQAWLDDYRTRLERSGRLLINAELALGSS